MTNQSKKHKEVFDKAMVKEKDIYLGTRHLAVSDLMDMNLVTPKLFGVITNAIRTTWDINYVWFMSKSATSACEGRC